VYLLVFLLSDALNLDSFAKFQSKFIRLIYKCQCQWPNYL